MTSAAKQRARGKSRLFEFVQIFNVRVQRRVRADGQLGAGQIIVDGRGQAKERKIERRETVAAHMQLVRKVIAHPTANH